MKTKLIILTLLAAGAVFAQVSIGVRIGAPPPDRVLRTQPRSPGNEYVWIGGYWYPSGQRYKWHKGYWTRPPYSGARWLQPHHDGERFFEGRWEGERGDVNHSHRWDRGRDHKRDYDREHDRDRDQDRR